MAKANLKNQTALTKVSNAKIEKVMKTEKVQKAIKLKSQPETKISKSKSGLKVDVIDISGKVIDSIDLPNEIFGVKINKALIAQAVRVYLANQRQGSASTKTRGEVRGSTRKIYRQKGTGRARHGAVRAPIFVHGGIAHGPKPRDYSLKLPQKMKKAALYSALSAKLKVGALTVVDGIEKTDGKTKSVVNLFNTKSKKTIKTLFVIEGKHENLLRSIRNIEGVTYEYAYKLHAYGVIENQRVFFMKNAITYLKKQLDERVTEVQK